MAQEVIQFDPVRFSLEENAFLIDALGKPPMIALRACPASVNRRAIEPLLNTVFQLVQAESAGERWVGVEMLKAAASSYLEQVNQWLADRKKGAPRFPSLYTFDSRGRGTKGAVGSDSGTVKTYFTKDGQRKPFAVDLVPTGHVDWHPEWALADVPKTQDGVKIDDQANRIECLVCQHTESFKPTSQTSLKAAKGRMMKHLKGAKEEMEAHREAALRAFGG